MSARQHQHFATPTSTPGSTWLDRLCLQAVAARLADDDAGQTHPIGIGAWSAVSPSDGLFQRRQVRCASPSSGPNDSYDVLQPTLPAEQAIVQHRHGGAVLAVVVVPARELCPGVWALISDWQQHCRLASPLARDGELWRAQAHWEGAGLPDDVAGVVLCITAETEALCPFDAGASAQHSRAGSSTLSEQLSTVIKRAITRSAEHPGLLNMAVLRRPVGLRRAQPSMPYPPAPTRYQAVDTACPPAHRLEAYDAR